MLCGLNIKVGLLVLICAVSTFIYILQESKIKTYDTPKEGYLNITEEFLRRNVHVNKVNSKELTFYNTSRGYITQMDTLPNITNQTDIKDFTKFNKETHIAINAKKDKGHKKLIKAAQYKNITKETKGQKHNDTKNNDIKLRRQYQVWYLSLEKTPEVEQELYAMFEALLYVLKRHGFTYVTVEGTLLGSYRHHGMIPWDDDIDILVNIAQQRHILNALKTLSPKYVVFTMEGFIWRFTSSKIRRQIPGGYWTWPYIDILFFHLNSTHFLSEPLKDIKSNVFPLMKRPFGSLMVNTPCKIEEILRKRFGDLDICVRSMKSHLHFMSKKRFQKRAVPCKILAQHFPLPLVQRTSTGSMITETLVCEEKVVHVKKFRNICT